MRSENGHYSEYASRTESIPAVSGIVFADYFYCVTCNGSGSLKVLEMFENGYSEERLRKCPDCKGLGKIMK